MKEIKVVGNIEIEQDGIMYTIRSPYREIKIVPNAEDETQLLLYSLVDMLFNLN